jgi:hypothetical protein
MKNKNKYCVIIDGKFEERHSTLENAINHILGEARMMNWNKKEAASRCEIAELSWHPIRFKL